MDNFSPEAHEHTEQPVGSERSHDLPDITDATLRAITDKYCPIPPTENDTSASEGLIESAKRIISSTERGRNARDTFLEEIADRNRRFVEALGEAVGETQDYDAENYATGITAVLEAYNLDTNGSLLNQIEGMDADTIAGQKASWEALFAAVSEGNPFTRAAKAPRYPSDYDNLQTLGKQLAGAGNPGEGKSLQMGVKIGSRIAKELQLHSKPSEHQSMPPLVTE